MSVPPTVKYQADPGTTIASLLNLWRVKANTLWRSFGAFRLGRLREYLARQACLGRQQDLLQVLEWYWTLVQSAIVELRQTEARLLGGLILFPQPPPVAISYKVGWQLSRTQLGAPQLAFGLGLRLKGVVLHQIEGLLIRHVHGMHAHLEHSIGN